MKTFNTSDVLGPTGSCLPLLVTSVRLAQKDL